MDESEKLSNQEESQNLETTTNEETPADATAAGGEQSSDLLKKELDSLEKMVVEKLNSDETKATIESAVVNPVVSLAQGFTHSAKGLVNKVEGKIETWSSLLHKKQTNGTEETDSLPTSDGHVGESSAADTEKYVKFPEPKIYPNDNANNGDHEQTPRSTENQSLIGMTPQTKTSWMNCCGLLEVLVRKSDQ
ncbi:uncharacterized protein [Nicotiana sylvestris]|uniref:Uncharacterized protein LOC104221202 n=1 Tax=Nicotiana sylvestris TaxID=4096 RepID=A0A1U7VZW5_NICSY|nr:PREDICTED: uncharacterized protein LOC104221202 [Nicotiana sylvestris]XP_016463711.1 PREDICTED: uncharacterized protein LOC107786707 [Nicotiana tabacum]